MSISRRTLISSSVLGLGAGLSGIAFAKSDVPQKWDEEVDIVIVGSGFAGLTAAYVAKKAGANVVVLEKMPTPGGNSIINGGIMGVPGTELQKEKGIEDSPEKMAADMLKAGLGMNHPDKVKALCESAYPAYRMLVDELGVEFHKDILKHEGGHSVPRSMFTINGSGSEIVKKLLAGLEKLGVEPRTRTIVDEIHRNDKGEVVGVTVRENYRFGREDSGRKKTIRAKKAVILAHGGFGADVTTARCSIRSSAKPSRPRTSRAQRRSSGAKPLQSARS